MIFQCGKWSPAQHGVTDCTLPPHFITLGLELYVKNKNVLNIERMIVITFWIVAMAPSPNHGQRFVVLSAVKCRTQQPCSFTREWLLTSGRTVHSATYSFDHLRLPNIPCGHLGFVKCGEYRVLLKGMGYKWLINSLSQMFLHVFPLI